MAQAQALRGKACSYQPDIVGPIIPEFATAPHFLPIVLAAGVITVKEKAGVKFACNCRG
jgi:hypothetical protein